MDWRAAYAAIESPRDADPSDVRAYVMADARLCFEWRRRWDETYIRVGGLWYDRVEWLRYVRERRRWRLDDPTVVVERPVGFR